MYSRGSIRLTFSVALLTASLTTQAADDSEADLAEQEGGTIEFAGDAFEGFQFTEDGLSVEGVSGIIADHGYEEKLLFGGSRQFIYQHDFSFIFSDPSETATNRSSLRFKWNRVFGNLLNVHIDLKPLFYFGGDNHRGESEEAVDSEFNVKEVYLQASVGSTSVTLGDKVVIWGESESSAVTDVISPQNLTDLVFTSLDESRISQTMLVVDHYLNQNQLTFIANPDIEFDEDPPAGDVFEGVEVVGKEHDKKDIELGFRWKSAIGNGDFSIMLADLVDNRSVFKAVDLAAESVKAVEYYNNYQMLGAAANLNYGDMALQIESAYNRDRAQQAAYDRIVDGTRREGFIVSDEIRTSVTLKYQENGLRDWVFGIFNTHYFEDVNDFAVPERTLNELFFSVSNKFLHETLSVEFQMQYEIETEASIQRFSAVYAITDNLDLSIDIFNLDNIGTDDFEQSSFITRLIYSF